MITVTINRKKIELEKPVTILKAAGMAGIEIPTLCNHEMLEAYGGCRLCLVEIEKMPRLQTSCTQYVTDGMVVWTETERVVEARKAMLEFLLINHALDCPYCDKAGECDLQDMVAKYGPTTGRFAEGKRRHPESFEDPIIVRNMERCISCTRCVRMCSKVQGAYAISMVNRSNKTFVEPFSGGKYDCEYCGNCLTVCPVGAIMSRMHRHAYRPWLIEKEVDTVCSFCGVGCSMVLQVRGNSIVRAVPKKGAGSNKGLLCNRGRFGYDYVGSSGRLDSPMIKRDGKFQRASWSEAFTFIADRLKKIKDENGGSSIAGIASGRCTNEDGYVFQKFMRAVLGSNNIDSVASFGYAQAQRFFEGIFGQGVTANSMRGIPNSDGVFVVGGDPTAVNPVLGLQIRAASGKGVPVVAAGYMPGLMIFATSRLIPRPFTETALLSALVTELRDIKGISGKGPFDILINDIPSVSLGEAEEVCGIPSEDMRSAVDALSRMTNPSIVIGRDILQQPEGQACLLLLAALISLLNSRIYLLSELPNEQGLVDMGCLPDMLPGGRHLSVESFRRRYEEFFGVDIPSNPGMGIMEMIEAAHDKRIKALHVMGEDLVYNMPDSAYVKAALSKLDFLVVHDIFMTETAQLADVVIPSLSWAEKEGSYTNLERKMQLVRKAVEGKGMEEWRAVSEISKLLGFDMDYKSSVDIMTEIANVSPLHKDIAYADMAGGECMWPYKGEPLRHGMSLEGIEMPDKGSLLKKPEKDRIYIGIDKPLFHFENLSRNSAALSSIAPEPYMNVGKALADSLSLAGGDSVSVSTGTGSLKLSVQVDPDVPENSIMVPDNFGDKGAYTIMKWKMNSAIKAPVADATGVTIKKIKRAAEEVAV
ncbi:MAG: molybdopterin-dependent oxidoreductase [Nitrospirae bacterium]|nr:molybdopterin-dependent oxidoreductase [Nitrospirota bacterium]